MSKSPSDDALYPEIPDPFVSPSVLKSFEALALQFRSAVPDSFKLPDVNSSILSAIEALQIKPSVDAFKIPDVSSSFRSAIEALQAAPSSLHAFEALQVKLPFLDALKAADVRPSVLKAIEAFRTSTSVLDSFVAPTAGASVLEAFKAFQVSPLTLMALRELQRGTVHGPTTETSPLAASPQANDHQLTEPVATQARELAAGAAAPPRTAEEAAFGWFRRLSPQMQMVIVLLFFVWKLVGEPLEHAYVERWVSGDPESRAQTITEVNQYFGTESARSLRCVRGSGVNVREGPSTRSPVIDRLRRGQAVAVLDTDGGFSKIRYSDPGRKKLREGWAASGYLVGGAC